MESDFEKLLKKIAVPVRCTKSKFFGFVPSGVFYFLWRKLIRGRLVWLIYLIIGIAVAAYIPINLREGGASSLIQLADTQMRDELIRRVGELVIMPDEEPRIATVANTGKLKGNPFFKKAESGDKVIIFEKADRVILYDVRNHKIKNIGSAGEAISTYHENQ